MKRDIKYIIKKVIIGVLLFLIISFIKNNVNAFTIQGTDYNFSYDFIIESFERNSDFNLEDYPNIICGLWSQNNIDELVCVALPSDLTNSVITLLHNSNYYYLSFETDRFRFNYDIKNKVYTKDTAYFSSGYNNVRVLDTNTGYYLAHSNFKVPNIDNNYQPYFDLYPQIINFSEINLQNDSSYNVTSSNYNDEKFLVNYFNHFVNDVSNLHLLINNFNNVYTFYNSSNSYFISYCNNPTSIYNKSITYYDLPSLFNCVVFNHSSSFFRLNSGGSASLNTSSYIFSATEDYSNLFGTRFKKVLDFSSFLYTTYMKIDYLDNSYNVIKSVECTDNTDNLCNFNINSNTGSFIKVTYYLSDLIGRNLDFLDNDTYQFQFDISGITEDTKIENLNYWYYFGGSTNNVDSELVYPQSIKRINNNNSSTFNIAFLNNTGHSTSSVYEFVVYLKTNGSSYDTISIPYNFILNTLGNNLTDVDVSNLNNQDTQIDQTQTMINQNNQMIDNQHETNQKLDEINNTLNDDNISGASSQASDFFSNFTTDSHGLTGIITAPLNLISSITSTTCSPLVLPIPFVNTNLTLPCLSSIYSQYFGSFLTIYQSITFGIVAYWVCVRIFNLVKDFKNPDHDEIEVLDL